MFEQNRVKLVDIFLQLHNILIHNKAGSSILYSDPEFLLFNSLIPFHHM